MEFSVVKKRELLEKVPTVRVLAKNEKEAFKKVGKIYPDMDLVTVGREVSDHPSKTFFTVAVRPPSQKGIGDF